MAVERASRACAVGKGRDHVRFSRVRRAGALVLGAAVGAFGLAGAAFAHVTISPSSAPQGGFTVVTFRVPTESDTASTTKIQLFFDLTTNPIAVVDIQPVPGWTAKLDPKTLSKPIKDDDGNTVTTAIGDVTWTATSAATAIKPGEFQQFPVELGPLPTTGSVTFKILQTYSDGSIVRWIDTTTPGQPEPEHPAPVLTLTPASAGDPGATPAPTGGTTVTATATDSTQAASTGSDSGKTWGIVGALLGLIGVILGGAAYLRSRNASEPPKP
jgi:uncharacterized protein YcnI